MKTKSKGKSDGGVQSIEQQAARAAAVLRRLVSQPTILQDVSGGWPNATRALELAVGSVPLVLWSAAAAAASERWPLPDRSGQDLVTGCPKWFIRLTYWLSSEGYIEGQDGREAWVKMVGAKPGAVLSFVPPFCRQGLVCELCYFPDMGTVHWRLRQLGDPEADAIAPGPIGTWPEWLAYGQALRQAGATVRGPSTGCAHTLYFGKPFGLWHRVTARGLDWLDASTPKAEPAPEPAWKRLRLREGNAADVAILDGHTYRLRGRTEIEFLKTLQQAEGMIIKAGTLERSLGERPSRIYKRLTAELQVIIDKPYRGTKGYRML